MINIQEGATMLPVTVVIPNYNGNKYLDSCIESLIACEDEPFPIIIVDDCSTDGSGDNLNVKFNNCRYFGDKAEDCGDIPGENSSKTPKEGILVIRNEKNIGFAASVNRGIVESATPYVILLNNDTVVKKGFVKNLCSRMARNKRYFSCQARMVCMDRPDTIDSAGDFYTVLGWARARGNGRPSSLYERPAHIFSACGGAAIYRREALISLGLFDEAHFAYLEDVDIGYRARLSGYINVYEPKALVLHAGSAVSGSRHNEFKVRLSSGNSLYLAYKNMHPAQLLLNSPLLALGHLIKLIYFARKGLGKAYIEGLIRGARLISNYRRSNECEREISIKRALEIQVLLTMNLRVLL